MNRTREIVELLAGRNSTEQIAARHDVTVDEVSEWKEIFLAGARASASDRVSSNRQSALKGVALVLLVICVLGASSVAADLGLNTFSPNTPAKASLVNENFAILEAAIETNDAANDSAHSSLQDNIDATEASLQADIDTKVNRAGDTMTGALNLPHVEVSAGSGGGLVVGTGGNTLRMDYNEIDSTAALNININSDQRVVIGGPIELQGAYQYDTGGGSGVFTLPSSRYIDSNYATCPSGRAVTGVRLIMCDSDQLCTRVRCR